MAGRSNLLLLVVVKPTYEEQADWLNMSGLGRKPAENAEFVEMLDFMEVLSELFNLVVKKRRF